MKFIATLRDYIWFSSKIFISMFIYFCLYSWLVSSLILSVLEWRLFWKPMTDKSPAVTWELLLAPSSTMNFLSPQTCPHSHMSHMEGWCLSSHLCLLRKPSLARREKQAHTRLEGIENDQGHPSDPSTAGRLGEDGGTHFVHPSEHLNHTACLAPT